MHTVIHEIYLCVCMCMYPNPNKPLTRRAQLQSPKAEWGQRPVPAVPGLSWAPVSPHSGLSPKTQSCPCLSWGNSSFPVAQAPNPIITLDSSPSDSTTNPPAPLGLPSKYTQDFTPHLNPSTPDSSLSGGQMDDCKNLLVVSLPSPCFSLLS